jgi:arylsulfatase A-like enzyme
MNTVGIRGHAIRFGLGVGLALGGLSAVAAAAKSGPPNILFIYADDLGLGDLSCYNSHAAWKTPHLDRFAAEGMRFTDAHSASSLCTPSRYALLTGRYAWRGRLKHGVVNGYDKALLEADRPTVASFMRERGCITALFGKWHLGLDWARSGSAAEDVDFSRPFGGGPLAHGFDQFFGISASLDMPPYVWLRGDRAEEVPMGRVEDSPPPRLWRAGPIGSAFRMEEVQPRLFAEARRFLTERAAARDQRPFLLFLTLASPHTPLLPTQPFVGSTPTTYGDFVRQLDADFGQLLATLDELGLARNTLVVFTSDNGFAPAVDVPLHARIGHDPSAGRRGFKSDLYEGGHRVPFLVRWPGRISPDSRSDALIGQVDFFATCAELTGVPLPAAAAEDSVSFLPVLQGARTTRTTLVNHSGEGRFAIREGSWKLLLWPGSGGWSSATPHPSRWLKVPATDLATLPPYQLYDLARDPSEQHNVANEHPAIVRRLGRLLREQIERGRSTPGARDPAAASADWPELSWRADFRP